ncbi:hypothetical protein AV530_008481 [Patagioenas fasciata monilis]|uniref:Uncharacterized protein n=1 Tax=Patagioenas fasciata monilis TaxID=372326 RepID=A0A1V4JZV1_PATFA|nr:hypothetical protein AV530_008481 [Patagioenas fasciata monilis]
MPGSPLDWDGSVGGEGAHPDAWVPPAGGGQPRTVLRCWNCGRSRRYLCWTELRPLGQDTPTGPTPEDCPA